MHLYCTYVGSARLSALPAISPSSVFDSCGFLMRKNRTVPTRLITVRAMKTVLRSLSWEGKTIMSYSLTNNNTAINTSQSSQKTISLKH